MKPVAILIRTLPVLLSAALWVRATPPPESESEWKGGKAQERIHALASSEVKVVRKNGSEFQGTLHHYDDSGFSLNRTVGGKGEVTATFGWDEVIEVEFAGDNLWKVAEAAVKVLSFLYRQRSPFFPVLEEKEIFRFLRLAEAYLRTGSPTEALGLIRTLEDWVDRARYVRSIEDTTLRIFLTADLFQEAVTLARQQIRERADPSNSSLAWIALALHHLREERYREAHLCSLHPILFDRGRNSPFVADAYLLLQIATLKMNQRELAIRYYDEAEASKIRIEAKPYLEPWHPHWQRIDWDRLKSDPTAISRMIDIESDLHQDTYIDPDAVPILTLPLQNHANR